MSPEITKIKLDAEGKVDRMMKIPEGALDGASGTLYWAGPAIRTPEGSVSREDFAAGSTVRWCFPVNEVHYILSGRAEITYRLPPLYMEEKTMVGEAGDVYVIPEGAMMEFKVDPSGPYKKMCVIMPGFLIDKYFRELPEQLQKTIFKKDISGYE